jgi:hypothetical protein
VSARAVATLVALLVVGFGGFGILSADAANPGGFAAIVNPLSNLPSAGELAGTSCTSAGHCVAVGLDLGYQPLSLTGDPSTWGVGQAKEVTLPATLNEFHFGSDLSAVSCTSSTFCVAVGGDGNTQPLVLAGDPATWTASQAREITLGGAFGAIFSFLSSVSCTSPTSCVAVGTDGNFEPFLLVGNPATWTQAQATEINLDAGGELDSVTCQSASSCVAVGTDGNFEPFSLSGDPSTWTAAQAHTITLPASFGPPDVGGGGALTAVACTSASSCLAVGYDENRQPLTLAGDPSTWGVAQAHEVTLAKARSYLLSVSCPSASSCVAAGIDGNFQPLIVSGDPSTTWTSAQAHEITLGSGFNSGGELDSISCASVSTCLATGIDANSQPLSLAGDPSTWGAGQAQEIALTGVHFGLNAFPNTLTCVSAASCLDLGNTQRSPYLIKSSPATWDTASAVQMTGVNPRSQLDGSACPTPTYCVAVGFSATTGEPLVLTGDPSTWGTTSGHVIALGALFGSHGALFSVACTSTTWCVAVGEDNHGQPIQLTGNPATWSSASAQEIMLSPRVGALDSITCKSAISCVAVGFTAGRYQQPLVLVGNPSSWHPRQITLGPFQGSVGALFSVACTSATYCVGVGYSGFFNIKPIIFEGNPAHWNTNIAFYLKVPKPTPTTVEGYLPFSAPDFTGILGSVSCEPRGYCVVVGADNRYAPLYKAGKPGSWRNFRWLSRPQKSAPSFTTAELTTTSCRATACYVGGSANGGDFISPLNGSSGP